MIFSLQPLTISNPKDGAQGRRIGHWLSRLQPRFSGRVPGLLPGSVSLLPDDGQLCFQHLVAGGLAGQGLPGEFPLTALSASWNKTEQRFQNKVTPSVTLFLLPLLETLRLVSGSYNSNS